VFAVGRTYIENTWKRDTCFPWNSLFDTIMLFYHNGHAKTQLYNIDVHVF